MVPLVWLGTFPQICIFYASLVRANFCSCSSVALLNLVVNDESIVGKRWYDVSLAGKPIMYVCIMYV